MLNRLDVRGPEVKVRVNIGSDFGLLSHAYEFRVHDMAQWLDRWDVDAVKKNAQTYLNERLDFRFRRRHVKVELWLPTYQRWEPLPYDAQFQEVATRYITSTEDKNIGILCSDWPMVALWKIVEIGRYEGVLCVSSDRRQTCYE